MSRSLWKGNFIDSSILKLNKYKKKIWSRGSTIPSFLIGEHVFIYLGNGFQKILITKEKVGFKFGAFAYTRKKKTHTKIKKKKSK
jgi:small subunit ribosomal protein S19